MFVRSLKRQSQGQRMNKCPRKEIIVNKQYPFVVPNYQNAKETKKRSLTVNYSRRVASKTDH